MEPHESRKDKPTSYPANDKTGAAPPILLLCRRYAALAIIAAALLLVCIGLNIGLFRQIVVEHTEISGEWVANFSRLGYLSAIINWLGLLLLCGAIFYGFRIARQARLDARRNAIFLEDAKQRTLEIAALYDTTQAVSGRQELTPLLENILQRANNLLSASGGAIFLYDKERNDFQIAVETGVGMPIGTHLPLDEGLGGQVAKTLQPVIANDYQRWENRSRHLHRLPIRATVCVPMLQNGELIGVLGVHEVTSTGTRRMFTEADAQLLSLFAANAAGVVHTARLLDELRCSEERFRSAAECASDLVYDRDLVTDSARFFGVRHAALRAGNQRLSYTMREFEESIHPEDRTRVLTALRHHMETGAPFSEEYRISHGGAYLNVVDRAVAIRNQEGKPVRLVGSVSDITERKRAEQLKSDFISFVTHQLRTPLSGVKWMLELAMDAKDNPEEMQSFITDARLSTDRIIRLVNDLLDVSRLERGRLKAPPQPVDLQSLTGEVIAEMNSSLQEMKQTLTLTVADDLPQPVADRQLLHQAITNLLANSVKYTPAGGKIAIDITAQADGVYWEIKDTGIGIPSEDQGRLFEKFFRAGNVQAVETEGTGLGLYLVRLIVEQFGGRVWCESEEGMGASFVFTLPIDNISISAA